MQISFSCDSGLAGGANFNAHFNGAYQLVVYRGNGEYQVGSYGRWKPMHLALSCCRAANRERNALAVGVVWYATPLVQVYTICSPSGFHGSPLPPRLAQAPGQWQMWS